MIELSENVLHQIAANPKLSFLTSQPHPLIPCLREKDGMMAHAPESLSPPRSNGGI